MAVTTGQSRWRIDGNLTDKITRSAKVLGRSAFAVDPVPGRVSEDLRNAVSPHWKRITASCALAGRTNVVSLDNFADLVKARRAALLVSDFRFVSRNKAARSAQLEKEFARFASSYGDDVDFRLEASRDSFGNAQSGKRKRTGNKSVRFADRQEEESWDVGFREQIQSDLPQILASSWSSDSPYQTMMLTQPIERQQQGTCESQYNDMAWAGDWRYGDNNSLYRSIDIENVHPEQEETSATTGSIESLEQAVNAESSMFLEQLAIPDEETQHKAVERLKSVERHLSVPQEDIIALVRNTQSLRDAQYLHNPSDQAPQLLSASLDTLLNDDNSTTSSSFFYCPHLACHQRLVYQNVRLPPGQKQRSCVHTDCSFVSHDLEGWIKHCTTLHHEFIREGHENCGFRCYSNEDTH